MKTGGKILVAALCVLAAGTLAVGAVYALNANFKKVADDWISSVIVHDSTSVSESASESVSESVVKELKVDYKSLPGVTGTSAHQVSSETSTGQIVYGSYARAYQTNYVLGTSSAIDYSYDIQSVKAIADARKTAMAHTKSLYCVVAGRALATSISFDISALSDSYSYSMIAKYHAEEEYTVLKSDIGFTNAGAVHTLGYIFPSEQDIDSFGFVVTSSLQDFRVYIKSSSLFSLQSHCESYTESFVANSSSETSVSAN